MTAAIGAVGLGLQVAGGITSANAAKQSGAAQKQQYYYQAGMSDLNAKIAEQNADFALNQGELSAMQFGMKAKQQAGDIKSAQGASGLDVNSGSAKDIQLAQKRASGNDMTMIRSNAAKTAYDYDVSASDYRNQANLYRMGGTNAEQAGQIKANASILGTATAVSDKWLQGSQVGLFNKSSVFGA